LNLITFNFWLMARLNQLFHLWNYAFFNYSIFSLRCVWLWDIDLTFIFQLWAMTSAKRGSETSEYTKVQSYKHGHVDSWSMQWRATSMPVMVVDGVYRRRSARSVLVSTGTLMRAISWRRLSRTDNNASYDCWHRPHTIHSDVDVTASDS